MLPPKAPKVDAGLLAFKPSPPVAPSPALFYPAGAPNSPEPLPAAGAPLLFAGAPKSPEFPPAGAMLLFTGAPKKLLPPLGYPKGVLAGSFFSSSFFG